MKLIDRYICKEFIGPCLSGLAAFAVILSGSTILFKMIDYAVKFNIGIKDLIIVISLQIPYIIALSIPMATLFATISCFGRLSNDLEILARKWNGGPKGHEKSATKKYWNKVNKRLKKEIESLLDAEYPKDRFEIEMTKN